MAVIEADTAEQAEFIAAEQLGNNSEHEVFHFSDAGLDGFRDR